MRHEASFQLGRRPAVSALGRLPRPEDAARCRGEPGAAQRFEAADAWSSIMRNTLRYGVLAIALLAPLSALAEFGDPSPNAWGIGGVNSSADPSPAQASPPPCRPGAHSPPHPDKRG